MPTIVCPVWIRRELSHLPLVRNLGPTYVELRLTGVVLLSSGRGRASSNAPSASREVEASAGYGTTSQSENSLVWAAKSMTERWSSGTSASRPGSIMCGLRGRRWRGVRLDLCHGTGGAPPEDREMVDGGGEPVAIA